MQLLRYKAHRIWHERLTIFVWLRLYACVSVGVSDGMCRVVAAVINKASVELPDYLWNMIITERRGCCYGEVSTRASSIVIKCAPTHRPELNPEASLTLSLSLSMHVAHIVTCQ